MTVGVGAGVEVGISVGAAASIESGWGTPGAVVVGTASGVDAVAAGGMIVTITVDVAEGTVRVVVTSEGSATSISVVVLSESTYANSAGIGASDIDSGAIAPDTEPTATAAAAAAPVAAIAIGVTTGVSGAEPAIAFGMFANQDSAPSFEVVFPMPRFKKARTTAGSNCVPAFRATSSRANEASIGSL